MWIASCIGSKSRGDLEHAFLEKCGDRLSCSFLITREEDTHRRTFPSLACIFICEKKRECRSFHIFHPAPEERISFFPESELLFFSWDDIDMGKPEELGCGVFEVKVGATCNITTKNLCCSPRPRPRRLSIRSSVFLGAQSRRARPSGEADQKGFLDVLEAEFLCLI